MWLGILTVDPVDRNIAGCEAISPAGDLKNTSLAWLPANQQYVGLGLFFLRWLKCYCINTCWSQMTPETVTMSLCGETVYLVCEKQCKSAVDDLWKVFPVFACSHHFPCCRFKWMTETVILGDLGQLMALELACVLLYLFWNSFHPTSRIWPWVEGIVVKEFSRTGHCEVDGCWSNEWICRFLFSGCIS